MASLNPRMRVADIVGEAPVVHGLVSAAEIGDYVDDDAGACRARSGLQAPLSAPVLRRPARRASASRGRSRSSRSSSSATKPSPRSTSRFRRRCSTCSWTCAATSGSPICSSATISALVEHISDRIVDHVSRARRRDRADGGAVRVSRTIPTPRPCSPTCRGSWRGKRRFHPVTGEIPSPLAPPPGCHFHPRCPFAFARCRDERPPLKEIAPGRYSACHLNDG